jgi:hypothetical protein
MLLQGFRLNESASVAQTEETTIVGVSAHFDIFRQNVQLRQNLAHNVLLAKDAGVSEKREFAALRVISHAAPWEFLILGVGDLPTPRKFCPVIDVPALVNCEVGITTCSGKRC